MRRLVILVTAILAWTFSTYDVNLYLGREHHADRVLLLVLGALVWRRPVFVLPFVLLVVAVVNQFFFPIGGYSTAEQFALVRVLIVFLATFLLQLLTGRHDFRAHRLLR